MKAIFKTNRIVVIATCLLMLFSTLSINVKAEEYDNYEFVAFITQCIENEKTISVLEKNGEDVTLQTKSEILRLYELNDYETLENYLNDNEYSISFIRDSNSSEVSRAFAVKTYTKRTPRSKTATAYVAGYEPKTATANWASIMSCDFSYNVNTYKIGNIYPTKITLESYFVSPDTGIAQLLGVSTPLATKSADGLSLTVTATYTLVADHQYFPFPQLNFGTYTDQGVARA
ncbi:hypothetical protein [Faecalitalea cylindroides]|uniref:hypothetical protein n=1 Tax=Faecalitalea cylindroides TaxID=39483 RepID=UPI000B3AEF77|nr:hypothetical protein [Faecalitalea cylindroides]MBM6653002.1 hypothetical protein [Faecalitalea cylindroides]OUN58934.1 hypothetical protein B5G15_08760 [Faecalitalea cylindroides]